MYNSSWYIIFSPISPNLPFHSFSLFRRSASYPLLLLLKALAVSDNVFLATAAAVQMYPAMATVGGQFEHLTRIYPYYQMLAWPLAHIVQLVSVWMMVLVAANRYVAVCHPLHASSLCSRRHTRCQIVAMVTACVIYSIPRFAEFR